MPRKSLSPWAQDQRRIRRLRAKVRAESDRAEGWMKASDLGWKCANELFAALKATGALSAEQLGEWEKRMEDQPF